MRTFQFFTTSFSRSNLFWLILPLLSLGLVDTPTAVAKPLQTDLQEPSTSVNIEGSQTLDPVNLDIRPSLSPKASEAEQVFDLPEKLIITNFRVEGSSVFTQEEL